MAKIIIVTGTRADFGIYKPVADELILKGWDVSFLVCGMHMSTKYGNSVDEIRKNNYKILAEVDSLSKNNTKVSMAKSTAIELDSFSDILKDENPDFVMILGDRGEMLAASISCLYLGIKTVHLHGGEVSGTVDESVRHAISKLATIHFTATKDAKNRLLKMGEDPWRVFISGAPRIDTILTKNLPKLKSLNIKYNLDLEKNDFCLFIFHPVVTEYNEIENQISIIYDSLRNREEKFLIISPNADAGSKFILEKYESFDKNRFKIVRNIESDDYLTILKSCKLMVGNSSSGIIEAASFKKPVINIGSRQNGRERSNNIIDVGIDRIEITRAFNLALSKEFSMKIKHTKNIYGDGKAAKKIEQTLATLLENMDDKKWIQKKIAY
ncbi:UDP-N-acetylglucosamine 2-epimerase [Enterococcus gallinarum]|uniref:UDP-N-acetylglucosamine 2-epimerase n=1 Tax=Enterococcus gallinarum TaxID=1353 RepID=UPI002433C620|nr:UDP-N-acetylglucosamine 2-epimerase [Enterococcus gallinarum]